MCEISLVGVGVRPGVQRIEHAGKHSSNGPTLPTPLSGEVRVGGEVIEQKQKDQEEGLV